MCLSIDFIVPLSLSYQFISTVQLLCRLNWDFALLHLGTLTYVLWHALNQFYAAIDFFCPALLWARSYIHKPIHQNILLSFCLLLSVPAFALTFRVLEMAMRAVCFYFPFANLLSADERNVAYFTGRTRGWPASICLQFTLPMIKIFEGSVVNVTSLHCGNWLHQNTFFKKKL